jgi:D-tyrosyl-tRNA(Tyr) deacylase
VSQADVQVGEHTVGAIQQGLLVLLGVHENDTAQDAVYLASKVARLRIFEDTQGRMNHDVLTIQGSLLVVSQFTLYGDCRKGRRPSFVKAARPPLAEQLYEAFVEAVRRDGIPVAKGRFGKHMAVSLVNDGPVTLIIESP